MKNTYLSTYNMPTTEVFNLVLNFSIFEKYQFYVFILYFMH